MVTPTWSRHTVLYVTVCFAKTVAMPMAAVATATVGRLPLKQ